MTERWKRTLVAAALGLALLLPGGGIARADSWQDRVSAGSAAATARGTTIEIAMLDRVTGQYRDNGPAAHTRIESASVMKVFIAEHVLHQRDLGKKAVTQTDLADMSRMLRASENAPANRLWVAYGANGIIADIKARYGLTETGPTSNTRYWGNTMITAHDMVVFYQRLMDGSGGLSARSRDWIVEQLRQSVEWGDGGRQFFGLRDGLPREQVISQKQGWMCCVNGHIYRHTSGYAGPDNRFIVVVLTREPSGRGGAHIEASITAAVRAMFPEGLVPRVQGQIGEMWVRSGGHRGPLGLPNTDEIPVRGGAVQYFQGGGAYWSPATGPHWVIGSILQRYRAMGYETGRLGYPTSDEIALPGGALSRFQGGYVYWSPATGAHAVMQPILAAYAAQKWETGRLRYPTSGEIALPGGGVMNRFQGGHVYWSSRTGAHWVIGSILGVYKAQGYQAGPLGYPLTDEVALAGGAVSHFEGGSVYWSPGRGAHALRGALLEAYQAQGAERGSLGYPVSDAYAAADGTRMDFQGGSLTVPSASSTTTTTAPPAAPAPGAPTGAGTATAPVAPSDGAATGGDAQP
ncbi:hypothetical protein DQ239_02970 [Blastococcus sp. TF02-09]|uniref:serine hydrolase n=1 Tax=Blastococcus sp. TF02-09 TaxID=2250576 RepID=UPI000DE948F0|nr:serine hydrolase [Blastococcus sp. TF02-9]RBY80069.1 hypothetical protein DQ239_02970 [Blastococcus sp. TF02-9]